MAKEAVQAVRQAELKAADLENEALQKKEAMIAEAKSNAERLLSEKTKLAQGEAQKAVAAAEKKGAELIEAARLKSENEVRLLKELAGNKEEAVISLVLSNVI